MNTPNKALMQQARETLSGRWAPIIGTLALCYAIMFAAGYIPLASFLVYGPFAVGISAYVLRFVQGESNMDLIWNGFRTLARSILAALWQALFVILWLLLFIVPGIIKMYAYSQMYFILAEDKDISARDALRKSEQLMRGKKWKLFCLHLRFIGWAILSILTCGIGFLWFAPYFMVSVAKFYKDIQETGEVTETVIAESVPVPVA